MLEIIKFQGDSYPILQTEGNMTQYARPFAKQFCKGEGYDIGYSREEWKLYPDSIGIDTFTLFNASNLPTKEVDYIYSSHCLEHVDDWVRTIRYWISKLKVGGVLFLYLPHEDQKYWRPWNNIKHKHILQAKYIKECMESYGMENIFYSERDLNHSFMVVGEKGE